MLTIFNRKELKTTYDIDEQSRIRDILSQNKIEYDVKVVDRNKTSHMTNKSCRETLGTMNLNHSLSKEYIIYVKKEDYVKANKLFDLYK